MLANSISLSLNNKSPKSDKMKQDIRNTKNDNKFVSEIDSDKSIDSTKQEKQEKQANKTKQSESEGSVYRSESSDKKPKNIGGSINEKNVENKDITPNVNINIGQQPINLDMTVKYHKDNGEFKIYINDQNMVSGTSAQQSQNEHYIGSIDAQKIVKYIGSKIEQNFMMDVDNSSDSLISNFIGEVKKNQNNEVEISLKTQFTSTITKDP